MRQLDVHYQTAWLIHSKIMEAMCEREHAYPLRGKVQIDDAYLGGERNGGMPGRGSEIRFQSSQRSLWMMRGTR